jgi:hypothetical protein
LYFCLVKCMGEISIGGVVMIRSGSFINWIIVRALAIGFRSFFVFLNCLGHTILAYIVFSQFVFLLLSFHCFFLLPSSASSPHHTHTRTPTLAPARLRFASSCRLLPSSSLLEL